jgi:hypothetical protein
MSTEAWTLLGLIVTTVGQIIMAYMMYHVRHSVNGMRTKLEGEAYAQGGRDQASGVDTRKDPGPRAGS